MKAYWIKRLSAALQIGQARLLISRTQTRIEVYSKKSLPCALDEPISSNAHMYKTNTYFFGKKLMHKFIKTNRKTQVQ
jgi:hypothetical protein